MVKQEIKDLILEYKDKLLSSDNDITLNTICKEHNIKPSSMYKYVKTILSKSDYNLIKEVSKIKSTKNWKTSIIGKYGVENVFQLESVKDKSKNTLISKYGVDNCFKSSKIQEKKKKTMMERYGVENSGSSSVLLEKMKATNIEKYGYDNYAKTDECKDKIKSTNIERYGSDWYFQSEEYKNKVKSSNLEKYGSEWYIQSSDFKNKAKETLIEKYGYDNYTKSDESKERYKDKEYIEQIKMKMKTTNLKKYGVEYYTQTKEYSKKSYNTHKNNNSFNISKPEDIVYELLSNKFPDIIRQYRSSLYPYNCDFYIPSLDIYIEYQGNWTHGDSPFNSSNIEHQNKLKDWKDKSEYSSYYNNAIYVWTDLDVRKRKIARQNNIKLLEFWTIEEVEDWLKKLLKF